MLIAAESVCCTAVSMYRSTACIALMLPEHISSLQCCQVLRSAFAYGILLLPAPSFEA